MASKEIKVRVTRMNWIWDQGYFFLCYDIEYIWEIIKWSIYEIDVRNVCYTYLKLLYLAILAESNGKKGIALVLVRQISHRKVGGVPRSWAAGSSHHDRLKGKSQKQYWFESNSWSKFRIHSIEEKKEALRTDSQSRQGEKMWQPEGILFAFSNNEFESKQNIIGRGEKRSIFHPSSRSP